MADLLLCYNKGCGKQFSPESNTETSCLYHSGAPVFHEGMKGWSCCTKRYTDFQEFLSAPGCTAGAHSNTKPAPPSSQTAAGVDGSSGGGTTASAAPAPVPAPLPTKPSVAFTWEKSGDALERLPIVATDAIRAAGKPQAQPELATAAAAATTSLSPDGTPPVGTLCVRNACGRAFESADTLDQDCVHHPGSPVFHEGSKFWSCCKKRTHDFEEFMAQKGCTTGKHLWVKPKTSEQVQCRHDWYQMGGDAIINIYAKKVDCDASFVEVNQTSLNAHIVFETTKAFDLTLDLAGYIVPAQSQVQVLGSKVEIKLKKLDASSWQSLNRKTA